MACIRGSLRASVLFFGFGAFLVAFGEAFSAATTFFFLAFLAAAAFAPTSKNALQIKTHIERSTSYPRSFSPNVATQRD
jgi:hypothetical protein